MKTIELTDRPHPQEPKEMTDKEILIKAIEKAFPDSIAFTTVMLLLDEEDNFDMFDVRGYLTDHRFAKAFWGEEQNVAEFKGTLYIAPPGMLEMEFFSISGIGSLSQDLEKENMEENYTEFKVKVIKLWQYHLQKMVLEEDPIKYLEQFL